MDRSAAGFQELPHTADRALHVWAPDLPGLLDAAARGMAAVGGAVLAPGARRQRLLTLEAPDPEGLLVAFLGELIFWSEQESCGLESAQLEVGQHPDGTHWLHARVEMAPLAALERDIKAVTYHDLHISRGPGGCETTITFDV